MVELLIQGLSVLGAITHLMDGWNYGSGNS